MADLKSISVGGTPFSLKDEVARDMISDIYNPTQTYEADHICIYNGKLYKATKETTGTWDETAWEETNVGAINTEISKIKTGIGTTSISDIGDGTLTGGVSSLNTKTTALQTQCDSGTVNDAKTLNGWKYVDVSHPQAIHIVNVGDNKELNYSTPTEILTLAEKNQNWTGTWQNKTLDISTVAPNGNWILIDSNNKIQHTTWNAVQSYQCGANINPNGISVRGGWMDFYNGNSMRGSFFCNSGDEMFLRGQNRLTFVTNEAKDNCNFYFSGTGKYTGNWVQTSAKKYKENIQSITEEEAQALLKIEPVSFDYKENGIHTYGFIADDVDELIPDSPYVIHDDGGEPDAIPYTAFVAPMLKLIQIQEKRITELQTKVKSLEANIMQ